MKLLVIAIIIFTFSSSLKPGEKNNDMLLCTITGKAIDLKIDKPIKRKKILACDKNLEELGACSEFIEYDKTDSNGNFTIWTQINKDDSQFWLKIDGYAQINFINIEIDETKYLDTIKLRNVYFVSYDNELEIESHNMPNSKKKKRKRKKLSLLEIDSIFNFDRNKYNMIMNPIDTTKGLETTYSFGSNRPRGKTIESFKTLSFTRDLKEK